jgi:dTDP-4-dehydrorhamnose reductase
VKILLLGANGQVGFELVRALAPLGELVCATRDGRLVNGGTCLHADLADAASLALALDAVRADVVVNAAAYTAVDRAEDEPELADRINHRALAEIGAWAARTQARIVHFSTDYVFDGEGTRPYREDDATAPLGVYGRSKLAGENALRDSSCDHLIFRTAWVYAARGSNFLRTMLRLARERDSVRVVNDQRGAPTTARLIADATAQALVRDVPARGTFHLCAAGEGTWFEFASAIFQRALTAGILARAPETLPIATSDYPTKAQRPAYSVLDTTKLSTAFGINLPPWEVGLDAVIGELATLRASEMAQNGKV